MGRTVYLLDDDSGVLDSVATLLRTHDMQVRPFRSPAEFLANMEWTRPCCILIDLRLPGVDGLAVFQSLRKQGVCVPAILLSAYASVETAVAALKIGFCDVLQKPFDPETLIRMVRSHVQSDLEKLKSDRRKEHLRQRLDTLTPREREVYDLLIAGRSGKQIARHIQVSYRTMEKHRGSVMRKMEATSLVTLVRDASELGLFCESQSEFCA